MTDGNLDIPDSPQVREYLEAHRKFMKIIARTNCPVPDNRNSEVVHTWNALTDEEQRALCEETTQV